MKAERSKTKTGRPRHRRRLLGSQPLLEVLPRNELARAAVCGIAALDCLALKEKNLLEGALKAEGPGGVRVTT